MVQKSLAKSIAWNIALRIVLFCLVVALAFFSGPFFLEFLKTRLGYVTPAGFFGFTLADFFVPMDISLVFWSGIIFGSLGKKVDYALMLPFLALAIWDYAGTSTTTTAMWLGLIGVAVLGNMIGYILKVGRQNYFGKN